MGKVYVGKGTAGDGVIRLDDGTGLPSGQQLLFIPGVDPASRTWAAIRIPTLASAVLSSVTDPA